LEEGTPRKNVWERVHFKNAGIINAGEGYNAGK